MVFGLTHALPIQEKSFVPKDPGSSASGFIWIRVVPEGPELLSQEDIYRLYKLRDLFAAVTSPKARGLKGPCVELTEEGRSRIDEFVEDERRLGTSQERADEVIPLRISSYHQEHHTKFYTQAQVSFFDADSSECGTVVDHRSKERIAQVIKDRVVQKGFKKFWTTAIKTKE